MLVTTLTKRMAEDLADYLREMGVKVHYLHSEIDTLERIEILRDLRLGVYDVVVGINLLREGLDLPEVSLVAILDADKEGYLRSESSLIQTIGRAARHVDGHVIMYADRVTDSMRRRDRRDLPPPPEQQALQRGARHHAGRHPARRSATSPTASRRWPRQREPSTRSDGAAAICPRTRSARLIKDLEAQMKRRPRSSSSRQAALLRDQIIELRQQHRVKPRRAGEVPGAVAIAADGNGTAATPRRPSQADAVAELCHRISIVVRGARQHNLKNIDLDASRATSWW